MLELPKREQSYWMSTSSEPSFPELSENLEVDVGIVGGGIAGLSAGYLLKSAGKSVAVLEKDSIAGGTTGRTTGKVTSQHSMTYADLYEHRGEKTARIYGQANQTAIGEIEKLIKKGKIDCQWQRADNYVYTRNSSQVDKFKQEAKVAKQLGLPADFTVKTPLPFTIQGAVRFADQAQFNAASYARALANIINTGKGCVFENTRAIRIKDGQSVLVETPSGTIFAKDVIVATNVPTFLLIARGGYCILEYPQTSYIVAARCPKKLGGMYISTDSNEYSVLPVGSNMVLIGGEGHIRGAKLNKRSRYQRLANYAQERFGATKIEYIWNAWDYHAYDDVPLVGRMYPWSKHLYVISAFRKWGLTHSMVAAMILRDRILGHANEWAEIYTPIRLSPITSIPRVIGEYI